MGRCFRDRRNTVIHLRLVTPRSTMFSSQRSKSEDNVVNSRHHHIAYSPPHSLNGKSWNVCNLWLFSWVSVNATSASETPRNKVASQMNPFFRANGRSRMFSTIAMCDRHFYPTPTSCLYPCPTRFNVLSEVVSLCNSAGLAVGVVG